MLSDYRKVAMLASPPERDRAALVARARRDHEDMWRAEYALPSVIKDRNEVYGPSLPARLRIRKTARITPPIRANGIRVSSIVLA